MTDGEARVRNYNGDPSELIRWRPDETSPPSIAVWEITLRCDLACRHCGSRAGRERPDELTTSEALDVVRQMADLGVKEVTLIGGEAYLRDLPKATLVRLDSGHFAVEDCLQEIASGIKDFYDQQVRADHAR